MSDRGGDVIRRKIDAASGRKPDAGVISYAEHICAKIGEALDEEPRFRRQPAFVGAEIKLFGDFMGKAPAHSLFCMSGRALIQLDSQLVFTWVEASLSGEACADPTRKDYVPAAIDCELTRPFLECLVAALPDDLPFTDPTLHELEVERNAENVRFVGEINKVVVITVSFAEEDDPATEARIVLPLAAIEELTLARAAPALNAAPNSAVWTSHMKERTLGAPLHLQAVIDRPNIKLSEVANFEVGQVLMVPRERLEKLAIVADDGIKLKTLGHGRLGAFRNKKAIKLNDAPTPGLKAILG